MATVSTDKILDLLRRSGLVEEERLMPFLDDLAERSGRSLPETPEQFADALVEAGLVTRWQADMLLSGKHKGFFLGKYKLLRHIGKGGMSTVYLAEHLLMRRRVAIKVLPKNRVDDSSYLGRFYQEARAAAQLDDKNIVRAYDVDNDHGTHFLVMEYVNGSDLHALVVQNGPLDYEEAANYVLQAARGLAHAHEMGLVHRDIKPANLLVDKKKTVKVLDMGLAKFQESVEPSLTLTHDEHVLGTADYLAPEQALNSHMADARSDIYSLGCTMYFLLTGHPPFNEGSIRERLLKHQLETPPSIYKDRPDASPSLVNICNRMMSKKPENRYQTAEDVSEVLTEWLKERGYEDIADSGDRLKRPDGLSSGEYPIGRLQRPPLTTAPSSETFSASNDGTATMRGSTGIGDEDLGFAPIEEEPEAEVEADASDALSGENLGTDSPSAGDSTSKPPSSVISTSLIEEELEEIPIPAPPSGGVAPEAAGTALRSAVSRSGPQRKAIGQGQRSDSQLLIWSLVAVGVVIMSLLLYAIFSKNNGSSRRSSPARNPLKSRPPAESTEEVESGSPEDSDPNLPDPNPPEDSAASTSPATPEPTHEPDSSQSAEPDRTAVESGAGDNR